MTDNPPQYIEPPPPRRAFVLRVVPPILNLVALILLLLEHITAGEVFVGLALLTGLIALFGSGSSTPPAGNTRSPNTPTNVR